MNGPFEEFQDSDEFDFAEDAAVRKALREKLRERRRYSTGRAHGPKRKPRFDDSDEDWHNIESYEDYEEYEPYEDYDDDEFDRYSTSRADQY